MIIINRNTVGPEGLEFWGKGQPQELLYWSTRDGWTTSPQAATEYKLSDIGVVSMPLEGAWMYAPGELVQSIAENHTSGHWFIQLSYVYHPTKGPLKVAVKAFGRWVQRLHILSSPFKFDVSEQKTLKAFKVETENVLKQALEHA